MKLILISILICLASLTNGQQLHIGLMRSHAVSSFQLTSNIGEYEIRNDSALICDLKKDDKLILTRHGSGIKISKNQNSIGTYKSLYLFEKKQDCSFTIQCLSPVTKKVRKYMNNLTILPESTDKLTIINDVEMSNYLAGVIESEGGGGKHIEYYKVQAILSRTYALDHLYKHQKEGFQLCDAVHCQAYLNMMRFTPTINDAVSATSGIIMLDQKYQLASGFFFANCGGQTSESDFVWNTSVPYCKSVRDTFCIHSKQANWTKRIPKSKWESYLTKQFGFPVNDSIYGPMLYYFSQPTRAAFYISPQFGIPLRDLRVEFDLKSTWFSCQLEGSEIVLTGKGFGHGVGLCQEGAMRMANYGYSYQQILNYYFTGIELFNYYSWLFLEQKNNEEVKL